MAAEVPLPSITYKKLAFPACAVPLVKCALEVTELRELAPGQYEKRSFLHRPFLVGVHADAPARIKLACWLAVAAYLACGWCLFCAQRLAGATGRQQSYPTGYLEAVPQPARDASTDTVEQAASAAAAAAGETVTDSSLASAAGGAAAAPRLPTRRGQQQQQPEQIPRRAAHAAGTPMLVGDDRLQQTDAELMERGRRLQALKGAARKAAATTQGCNGLSIIAELLFYVSYCNIWAAPVIHMLLYGVVAEFVRHILHTAGGKSHTAAARAAVSGDTAAAAAAMLATVSSKGKRIMSERAAHIQFTSDFGRPYRCTRGVTAL
jgi:hypothetical protein